MVKRRGAIGKKWDTIIDGGVEGWDRYNALKTDKDRKQWRIKQYQGWYTSYGKPVEKKPVDDDKHVTIKNFTESSRSIDVYLYILAKSKQATIDSFIQKFGNDISLFESYESALLKHVIEAETKLKKKLTDEEQADIYVKLLKGEKKKLQQLTIASTKPPAKTTQQKLQQYFTNDTLATAMIKYSSISSNQDHCDILEPTAGDGQIIKAIAKLNNIDFHIDMCELDSKNRIELEKLSKASPNILSLLPHKNFLTFIPSKRYDYIFMNPPFHIKKSTNALLLGDVFDFEFIKRAYAMLKIGGELIGITSKHWTFTKDMKDWTLDKDITHEIRENEKFGTIKMSIVLLKIKKHNEDDDAEILKTKFYRENTNMNVGEQILNGEAIVKDIKQNKALDKPVQEEKRINEEPSKKGKVIVVKTSPYKKKKGATVF